MQKSLPPLAPPETKVRAAQMSGQNRLSIEILLIAAAILVLFLG